MERSDCMCMLISHKILQAYFIACFLILFTLFLIDRAKKVKRRWWQALSRMILLRGRWRFWLSHDCKNTCPLWPSVVHCVWTECIMLADLTGGIVQLMFILDNCWPNLVQSETFHTSSAMCIVIAGTVVASSWKTLVDMLGVQWICLVTEW